MQLQCWVHLSWVNLNKQNLLDLKTFFISFKRKYANTGIKKNISKKTIFYWVPRPQDLFWSSLSFFQIIVTLTGTLGDIPFLREFLLHVIFSLHFITSLYKTGAPFWGQLIIWEVLAVIDLMQISEFSEDWKPYPTFWRCSKQPYWDSCIADGKQWNTLLLYDF